jgi:hypothetical protein
LENGCYFFISKNIFKNVLKIKWESSPITSPLSGL